MQAEEEREEARYYMICMNAVTSRLYVLLAGLQLCKPLVHLGALGERQLR